MVWTINMVQHWTKVKHIRHTLVAIEPGDTAKNLMLFELNILVKNISVQLIIFDPISAVEPTT